jgi:Asp-tRNA(Asn)/Glu-tRNA(Gln) amidotransferase A subunit family amidase
VPISIKDQIDVKGRDSTVGATMHIDEPAEEDATVIAILRDAGAIPAFVKTNVPQVRPRLPSEPVPLTGPSQTMLSFECSNPLFGATLNPYAHSQVPGGSSGGESAMLAGDASPLGVGSDVGGAPMLCRPKVGACI